jgi:hypothetical protein
VDVLIGSWADGTDSLAWLKNDGFGKFNVHYIPLDPRRRSLTFQLLDYENDSDPDIISATERDDLVLYLNDGSAHFEIMRLCQQTDLPGLALSLGTVQLNSDPAQDVMVLCGGENDQFVTFQNLNWTAAGIKPEETLSIPNTFFLDQNYPNPFNPVTKIRYDLPDKSKINLTVYDVAGRKIKTLYHGWQYAGTHSIDFDGSGLSSGLYFYQLTTADGYRQTRRMILIK